jgi:hypothetical protein
LSSRAQLMSWALERPFGFEGRGATLADMAAKERIEKRGICYECAGIGEGASEGQWRVSGRSSAGEDGFVSAVRPVFAGMFRDGRSGVVQGWRASASASRSCSGTIYWCMSSAFLLGGVAGERTGQSSSN